MLKPAALALASVAAVIASAYLVAAFVLHDAFQHLR